MTSADMITRLKNRTFNTNDLKLIGELNSARNWAWMRVYNSENGPDLLLSIDNEKTMASRTRDYDLGANITGTLYGIKQLWLRFPSDMNFTPMVARDMASSGFRANDQYPSSDTTTVATGHPVQYEVVNFAKLRFAPPLPINAVIRVDAWIRPPDIDPVANPSLSYGNDIPEPLHESICDKATAQVFSLMDDTRAAEWEVRAETQFRNAMYMLTKRNQGPVATTPYRAGRRRWC